MDFSRKISPVRPYSKYQNGQFDAQYLAEQFESDRGRIIQSAAIRRLQQKTQVFPLEKNSAVRSRLAHSLEVQQTGRHIVRTIYKKLANDAKLYGLDGLEREIETLVEMACLMHDIGNPPFGHFGEAAINDWFSKELEHHVVFAQSDDKMLALQLKHELKSFEGNAQAFRIIFNLLKLNLTYTQSASILKYTRCGLDPKPEKDKPLSYLRKKVGYYYAEQQYIKDMCQHLDIDNMHRFPLAYLMEAADDISYCLADIEDGVEKDLLTCEQLAKHLKDEFFNLTNDGAIEAFLPKRGAKMRFSDAVDYALKRSDAEEINKTHEFFVWLRVQLIHPLVDHAAGEFINNLDSVFKGNLNRALLEDGSLYHAMIETFKRVAIKYIFQSNEVETKELQGYQVISGLLNAYKPLLMLNYSQFKLLMKGKLRNKLIETRLIKRLANKHVKAYQVAVTETVDQKDAELHEFYYRCRLIQDHISGMTDQFALDEFNTLRI
jgi:dGTPase